MHQRQRIMAEILKGFDVRKALIVTQTKDDTVLRAAGNIKNVKTLTADTVNVYDLVNYDKLIITKDAVKKVEEVFA